MSTPKYIDLHFAKATGRKLAAPGPSVSADEARAIVADVRERAAAAVEPVAATSRMTAPGEAPAPLVVDRGTWIDVNVDSISAMMAPLIDHFASLPKGPPPPAVQAIGSRLTGAELGGMLAFLSSKVLGQYDLAPGGTRSLMLVAPNLVHVERELEVDPGDFRSWVCMHEETHRVQFTAVPWLADHVVSSAQALMRDLVPDAENLRGRFEMLRTRLPQVFRGESQGLLDLFATEEQRTKMADVTAVMSLLEGHADVVMDDVGPELIPTVATIRQRFESRRKGAGAADRLLRRLLGLEAKMRQYRDGAAFVRAVQAEVGIDGFNAVWANAENLPSGREITEPASWVRRVHGRALVD